MSSICSHTHQSGVGQWTSQQLSYYKVCGDEKHHHIVTTTIELFYKVCGDDKHHHIVGYERCKFKEV
jgi:hypothetical protein